MVGRTSAMKEASKDWEKEFQVWASREENKGRFPAGDRGLLQWVRGRRKYYRRKRDKKERLDDKAAATLRLLNKTLPPDWLLFEEERHVKMAKGLATWWEEHRRRPSKKVKDPVERSLGQWLSNRLKIFRGKSAGHCYPSMMKILRRGPFKDLFGTEHR